jgi:ribosomal protein L33
MAQKTLVILQNPKTGYTYYTHRNKKGEKGDKKLSLKKFDPTTREYALFEEQKGKPKAKKQEKKQAPKAKKEKKAEE